MTRPRSGESFAFKGVRKTGIVSAIMAHSSEILILGGGVIGCATARELAQAGHQVVIVERGDPCREASWAAAGALIARALSADEGPLLDFKVASLALFREHCRELTAETGIDTGFRETGGIDFFLDEEEISQAPEFLEWQAKAGIPAEALSESELRRMEPELNPEIRRGAYFPTFTQVRTPWYTRALLASALRHGARMETHLEAREFLTEGDHIVGIRTDRGEFRAETTLLCAGPWSPEVARLFGRRLPGVPVKGQILLLEDRARPVRHIVHHGKTYITPRDEGRMVVGSTEEWVGFQRGNTAEGIETLLRQSRFFYPGLGRAAVERVWHGFRPLTVDGLPYIGAFGDLPGLVVATGHYRSGIILAPLTARVVAELLESRPLSFNLAPFSPDRVAGMAEVEMGERRDLH